MTIRVLLVDDHAVFRQGLRQLLESESDVEIVGEASNGRAAIQCIEKLAPDVTLMDVTMPELNGINAVYQIVAADRNAKVIGLSMHTSDRIVVDMLRAGASGYVSKLSDYEEIIDALRVVASGKHYLSPVIAQTVIAELARSKDPHSVYVLLTAREREVLQLVAEGVHTKEIASQLDVSPRTIDVHRKNMMDKLSVGSVAELTRYAIREGLISAES